MVAVFTVSNSFCYRKGDIIYFGKDQLKRWMEDIWKFAILHKSKEKVVQSVRIHFFQNLTITKMCSNPSSVCSLRQMGLDRPGGLGYNNLPCSHLYCRTQSWASSRVGATRGAGWLELSRPLIANHMSLPAMIEAFPLLHLLGDLISMWLLELVGDLWN